ncbi:MAG: zinc ABC transporter substrate-binding protein [Anaerolineales bacterium]|nr:zinc ABC transporter substrate-binding protein [Anaerolineales bacterium]
MILKKLFLTITLAALTLSACSAAQPKADDSLNVLASTSVLADLAQNAAGERVQIRALIPRGADAHAYQAAPADVSKIAQSDVLILNGLGYERFIEPLLENAGRTRIIVVASAGADAQADDPHLWLDVSQAIIYVENIRDGLIQADPVGADEYRANAAAYVEQLRELDVWIFAQVETLPKERRVLVANHEALNYFARRYGFQIAANILPSFSSEASVSAQQIAAAIEAVRAANAPAIFLDEAENVKLAEQIASETGARIADKLHLETLTDDAPTYIDMMKWNTREIIGALKE